MKNNFHTHTKRCHHARGSDEAYVRAALKNGFQTLGFSDHSCWQYDSDFTSRIRMSVKDFDNYQKSIRKLQKKYAGRIDIWLGMEAEYFPQYMPWLKQFCIDHELDYLILGNHYEGTDETGIYYGFAPEEKLESYVDSCIEGLKTGMYAYLAHPDLPFRNPYLEWNDYTEKQFTRLCLACREMDIPLEYNLEGLRESIRKDQELYPQTPFWELAAKIGNKAIIGVDAHDPKSMETRLYDLAVENLDNLEIERVDRIEKIDFTKARV